MLVTLTLHSRPVGIEVDRIESDAVNGKDIEFLTGPDHLSARAQFTPRRDSTYCTTSLDQKCANADILNILCIVQA